MLVSCTHEECVNGVFALTVTADGSVAMDVGTCQHPVTVRSSTALAGVTAAVTRSDGQMLQDGDWTIFKEKDFPELYALTNTGRIYDLRKSQYLKT